MDIGGKISDEKLRYDIKRAAAKISALSSGKINQYNYPYLTGEEALPPQQHRWILEGSLICSAPEKALEKQTKSFDDKKQVEILQSLDLNNQQIQPYQSRTKSIKDIFSERSAKSRRYEWTRKASWNWTKK